MRRKQRTHNTADDHGGSSIYSITQASAMSVLIGRQASMLML
jgi:hypothetical protein